MVATHPPLIGFLAPERADELARQGRFGDTAATLRAAFEAVSADWDETVSRAKGLEPQRLDQQVGGEWSLLQTLRHLVFVNDVWVGDVVLERADAFHPWGIPPDFITTAAAQFGLRVDERPSLDEVLAARGERRQRTRAVMAEVDDAGLARTCTPRDGQFQVVGALQTVVFEEWAHLQYARRDLAVLEGAVS